MAQDSHSDPVVNPFPGLKPYEIDESRFFYSYGYRTDDVLSRLRTNKFLTLVGEAGSGKASLVNCAVIPTLSEGLAGKGGNQWSYTIFRPGTNPIRNLALALAGSKAFMNGAKVELNLADHLEQMLRENVQGLLNIFEKHQLIKEHNLLIFIDDFEDIFAYEEHYDNHDDILLFINLILKFIRRSNFPVYIMMALSSDFLSESSQYPGLPEMINDSQYMIPKMDASHLRKILTHAFKSGGITADPVLINTIVQDFDRLDANNYQLQYLLRSMVDLWLAEIKKYDQVLDMKYYEKAGGLAKAIELNAEKIYSRFTKVQKRICTYLFRCITQAGENNRTRAVAVEEVAKVAKCSPDQVIELINIFSYEQLELVEVIETYDIEERLDSLDDLLNHPFSLVNRYSKITLRNIDLVDCWRRLKQWVEEEEKYAEIYLRLVNAASLYRQGKKGYFTNPELEIALHWYRSENPGEEWACRYAPGFDDAIEYLLISYQNYQDSLRQERLRHEHKVKRDKQFRWLLIIGTLLSLTLAAWAFREELHEKKAKELMHQEGLKLDYVQNLDSLRALYIDALQDMDSAHIDRLRYKVRALNRQHQGSMREVMSFTEGMIANDSLCKRGIKTEIRKIESALRAWRENWKDIDLKDDSLVRANEALTKDFCEIIKGHCELQQDNLTSIKFLCGF